MGEDATEAMAAGTNHDLRSGAGRFRIRGRVSSSLELLERTCPVTLEDPSRALRVGTGSLDASSCCFFGTEIHCTNNSDATSIGGRGAGGGGSVATSSSRAILRGPLQRTNSVFHHAMPSSLEPRPGAVGDEEEEFRDPDLLLTVDEAREIIRSLHLHSFEYYQGLVDISNGGFSAGMDIDTDLGHSGDGTATTVGRMRTYPEETASIARELNLAFLLRQRPVLALRPEVSLLTPVVATDIYLGVNRGFQP